MSDKKAIPLCLPNNTEWCERTGVYSKVKGVARTSLKVTEAAQRRLVAIKGPVCVISIAGPCRRGKSYILSKLFGQGDVFPLGHSLDPETMGIWMWVVPEKHKVFTDISFWHMTMSTLVLEDFFRREEGKGEREKGRGES